MTIALNRRTLLAAGGLALALPPIGLAPAASAQAAAGPALLAYPRQVGALEVTAILDGYLQLGSVLTGIPPEDLEAAMAAAYLEVPAEQRTGVTAHLVRGGGQTVLIDAGVADLFGPTAGRLPAALDALGVAASEVDAVLLTHMHPDHIGGLLAGGVSAFPNATLHVSETELGFWTDDAIASQAPDDFKPFFAAAAATAAAYGDRLMPFNGDIEVLPGMTALALPGHTLGHTGYRIESDDAMLLVFGDAASFAAVQFAHPEAAVIFDTDPALAVTSRRRLFDMAATDRLLVAGTHLPFPGVGHVARAGEAFAWVPEEWRYN